MSIQFYLWRGLLKFLKESSSSSEDLRGSSSSSKVREKFVRFVKFVRNLSEVRQKFVKFVRNLSEVRQRFVRSSSSSSQKFVKSSSNSSEAWAGVLIRSQNCGVSDTQTCGEMRVLFVLGQPSAEIVRVGWASIWCGEMRNFFARSNRLRRSCVSNAQACGGMWISFGHGQPSAEIAQVGHPNMWQNVNLVGPGAAPSHKMRVNRQKLV